MRTGRRMLAADRRASVILQRRDVRAQMTTHANHETICTSERSEVSVTELDSDPPNPVQYNPEVLVAAELD